MQDSWGAACRRRQVSALQTMHMPLDGAKYDRLLKLTVTVSVLRQKNKTAIKKLRQTDKHCLKKSKSSKQRSHQCTAVIQLHTTIRSKNLEKKIVKSLSAKTSSSHCVNPRDNASSRCDKVIFCLRPFYIHSTRWMDHVRQNKIL